MMIAYFDCFSGISGDMTLGAMVDLGVPVDWLKAQLTAIPLDGFDIRAHRVSRHGIGATKVEVVIQETHHHRSYRDIRELIRNSGLSDTVKTKSMAIFHRIAEAEAAIHSVALDEVHFHEVGSMDAIVDVVGTCLCLERLNIGKVVASPLPLGKGFVQCQHGTLPVPAPATIEILKGIPVFCGHAEQEMVTPTGAAIAAELAENFVSMPAMSIERVGYGAGTRDLEIQPNLLRVIAGRTTGQAIEYTTEHLVMVESNIDDMNPEVFGYLMDKLFADGALDVVWVPVYMKKNRPGTMIQVLCEVDQRAAIVDRILAETTTLGVRFYQVQRTCLEREVVEVETRWGRVEAKKVTEIDGTERIVPEFDACRRIADLQGVALRKVYDAVINAVNERPKT